MARRNFSRPHRLHALNELNVTPLLDLCFCLLIIFMIATPVLEQTSRVDLPETSNKGAATKGPKPKSVFVSFTADGSMQLGERAATIEDLRAKFREIASMDKESQPVIVIRGDRRAPYDVYARIVDVAKTAGLTKLGAGYQE